MCAPTKSLYKFTNVLISLSELLINNWSADHQLHVLASIVLSTINVDRKVINKLSIT